MSCKVLVVPEDPTYNGAILQPLVSRILAECGKPNARVTILADPKAAGFEHACSLMGDIVERYKHLDLLLLLVDADGVDRAPRFRALEESAAAKGVVLICCAAVQEVETWLLAGHVDKLNGRWADIRADPSVKERTFEPFLREYGDSRRPGGGREQLMKETLANHTGLLQRCPELAELQRRVCSAVREADAT